FLDIRTRQETQVLSFGSNSLCHHNSSARFFAAESVQLLQDSGSVSCLPEWLGCRTCHPRNRQRRSDRSHQVCPRVLPSNESHNFLTTSQLTRRASSFSSRKNHLPGGDRDRRSGMREPGGCQLFPRARFQHLEHFRLGADKAAARKQELRKKVMK